MSSSEMLLGRTLRLTARGLAPFLRRRQRVARLWRRFVLEVEVNGSLSSYQFGQNLCLDSNVRLGRGQGRLEIGHNVGLGCATAPKFGDGGLLLEPRSPQAIISIGSSTNISNNVSIIAVQSVCIGEFCRIGDAVEIFDSDFHEIDPIKRDAGPGRICPVAIGNNVWLGSRVLILRGVNIGDNSVIGAGSVVTNSIPADSVAAGVPARFIRHV